MKKKTVWLVYKYSGYDKQDRAKNEIMVELFSTRHAAQTYANEHGAREALHGTFYKIDERVVRD